MMSSMFDFNGKFSKEFIFALPLCTTHDLLVKHFTIDYYPEMVHQALDITCCMFIEEYFTYISNDKIFFFLSCSLNCCFIN